MAKAVGRGEIVGYGLNSTGRERHHRAVTFRLES